MPSTAESDRGATLAPGTRIGPYEIQALLGTGGMGQVYRARDTRLDRSVALKVLHPVAAGDGDVLRRFEQEARAVAALNHPNVLVLHDLGTHADAPYLVSELLEGETLRQRLERSRISLVAALQCAREVAHGMAAAHAKGIVHRDLKPENIFITRDGRAKILDFGLAKLAPAPTLAGDVGDAPTGNVLTQPGMVLGTAGYMAPEQVRGEEADSRADIFSFGVVLYEMLCGRRPFGGASMVEMLHAILTAEPPALTASGAGLPPGLVRIVTRCLQKDTARRFQSADDLAFALEALDGQSDPMAQTAAVPALQVRPDRRWIALALLAAPLLVAGGWLAARATTPRPPTPTFQQLTHQLGAIRSARFSPDGQTVVYSAAWGGQPERVFTTLAGSAESRSLELPEKTRVLGVSSSADLLLRLSPPGKPPVLARVPLAGGVPRSLLENVSSADWAPDANDLAVVRRLPTGGDRLEYPVGHALAEVAPPRNLHGVRVAPRGDQVAFFEGHPGPNASGRVCVVDRQAKQRCLTPELLGLAGSPAWSDDGRQIYFSGTTSGAMGAPALWAVDLAGQARLVFKSPGELQLFDASRARFLVGNMSSRMLLDTLAAGDTQPHDLGWLNWSRPYDLSADGLRLLFDETRASTPRVYLRTTDGAPALRLADGQALALSPDGAWAATVATRAAATPIVLVPTGAGESITLAGSALHYADARFRPDGQALVARANAPGQPRRFYLVPIAGGAPVPIAGEGLAAAADWALAPDGSQIATLGPHGAVRIPIAGGEAVPLPGFVRGEAPVQWSADGGSIYAAQTVGDSVEVTRVELTTGRRSVWKRLPLAGERMERLLITPDARTYVLGRMQARNELYLIDGLH